MIIADSKKEALMKTIISLFTVFLLLFAFGCSNQPVEPEPVSGTTLDKVNVDSEVNEAAVLNFVATLSGDEEVPPTETRARGTAHFQLRPNGDGLSFKLVVANIMNVTMAHIHLAPAGQNGGVVVWLYPSEPPAQLIPGRFNGVLAHRTITEANLVGALAGEPLSALIDEIQAGNAYVNVHTSQYPGGEIRGQISMGN